ncbi:MAG: UPF0182 family protein [Ignavibacteriaceae bacterium]
MKLKSIIVLFAFLIIAFLVLFSFFAGYYGDWLWFRNMGFGTVFTTILWAKILLFFIFFFIFGIFAWGNITIARVRGSHTRSLKVLSPEQPIRPFDNFFSNKNAKYSWAVIILFFSFIMGSQASGTWRNCRNVSHVPDACEPMMNEKNRIITAHEYLAFLLLKKLSKGLMGCSGESTFKERV